MHSSRPKKPQVLPDERGIYVVWRKARNNCTDRDLIFGTSSFVSVAVEMHCNFMEVIGFMTLECHI